MTKPKTNAVRLCACTLLAAGLMSCGDDDSDDGGALVGGGDGGNGDSSEAYCDFVDEHFNNSVPFLAYIAEARYRVVPTPLEEAAQLTPPEDIEEELDLLIDAARNTDEVDGNGDPQLDLSDPELDDADDVIGEWVEENCTP